MGPNNESLAKSGLQAEPSQSSQTNERAVSFRNVGCTVSKKLILDCINLEINKGQVVGLLGPNGAGKTTALSLVTGLRRHSTGEITVLGESLPARGTNLRRRIGVVLQETALYDELTTNENLELAASLYDVGNAKERIAEVLQLLRLTDRARESVRTLSGGLRRRVAIARALLHKPELLIIDEPTLGVDVEARHAIWSHLRLLRSQGTTILVSTNYLDEALALCTNVAVLCDGKLVAYEAPDSLIARTGNCLDVECSEAVALALSEALQAMPGVLRVETAPTGLTVFLSQDETLATAILEIIMTNREVQGVRRRAPDLAEVFTALRNAI